MTDMRAAALKYASLGLPVFPCSPKKKAPLVAGGFYTVRRKWAEDFLANLRLSEWEAYRLLRQHLRNR